MTCRHFWRLGPEILNVPRWGWQSTQTVLPNATQALAGALHYSHCSSSFGTHFSTAYPPHHHQQFIPARACERREEVDYHITPRQKDNPLFWVLTPSDPGSPSFLVHWELSLSFKLMNTLLAALQKATGWKFQPLGLTSTAKKQQLLKSTTYC